MKPVMRILLWSIAAVILVAVLAAGYLALTFDSNNYKARIAGALSEKLGRTVSFNGNTHLSFFPNLNLTAEDVELANPAWAGDKPMLKAENVAMQLAWLPLLSNKIEISSVKVKNAVAVFISKNGQNNWNFATDAPTDTSAVTAPASSAAHKPITIDIANITLENTVLTYQKDNDLKSLQLDKATIAARLLAPFTVTAAGVYLDKAVTLEITGGTVGDLLGNSADWPVKGAVHIVDTDATFSGVLKSPLAFAGADVNLSVTGTAEGIGKFTHAMPPFHGDYKFTAHLVVDKQQAINLEKFVFTTGATKAAGDIKITNKTKLNLAGAVNFAPLDIADFGAPASVVVPAVPNQSAASAMANNPVKNDGRLIPAIDLPIAGLQAANATLKITAAPIMNGAEKIGSLETTAILANGQLSLTPLHLIYKDYILDGTGSLAALENGAGRLGGQLRLNNFNYGALLKNINVGATATGTADLAVNFSGTGKTLREVAATSSGSFTATGKTGTFETGTMLGVIGNVALANMMPGFTLPTKANIQCSYLDFKGANGVWQTTQSAINSSELALTMRGGVNLGTETIDMLLAPHLKNEKFKQLLPPVRMSGRLAAPSFAASKENLADTAISAAAMLGGHTPSAVMDILGRVKNNTKTTDNLVPTNACMASVQNDLRKTDTAQTPAAAEPAIGSNPDALSGGKAPKLKDQLTKGLLNLLAK